MMRFTKAVYLMTLWIVLSMSCALLWISFPELWPHVPVPSSTWTDSLFGSTDPDDIAELQLAISFVICAGVMAAGVLTIALIRLKYRLRYRLKSPLNCGLTET